METPSIPYIPNALALAFNILFILYRKLGRLIYTEDNLCENKLWVIINWIFQNLI